MDWDKLKTEVQKPEYSADTGAQLLTKLKSNTLTIAVDITTDSIRSVIGLSGDLYDIDNATTEAAKKASHFLANFDQFSTSDPNIGGLLNTILNDLVADSTLNFSTSDKAAVFSLSSKTMTIEESLGQGSLRLGEIEYARTL